MAEIKSSSSKQEPDTQGLFEEIFRAIPENGEAIIFSIFFQLHMCFLRNTHNLWRISHKQRMKMANRTIE
jgi:hypothetical protein